MPASYAEVVAPLPYIEETYRSALRGADLADATAPLRSVRQVKTAREIRRIRLAHEIAAFGNEAAEELIRSGVRESELAAAVGAELVGLGTGQDGADRVGAYPFAMSGPNGAGAHLQFQQTSDRAIERGDFVLVHVNSHVDGYWTDVTRTFVVGRPNDRQRHIYMSVLAGLQAGLGVIRDGARAADADAAARGVLEEWGYGEEFKHGLGHVVGFKAIYHSEPPVLTPGPRMYSRPEWCTTWRRACTPMTWVFALRTWPRSGGTALRYLSISPVTSSEPSAASDDHDVRRRTDRDVRGRGEQ